MKKMSLFFVVLLALFFVLPASAQWYAGALGGVNLSNISTHPDENGIFANGLAYGSGGVLDYDLGKYITLHMEPMYLQKAVESEEESVPAFRQV